LSATLMDGTVELTVANPKNLKLPTI